MAQWHRRQDPSTTPLAPSGGRPSRLRAMYTPDSPHRVSAHETLAGAGHCTCGELLAFSDDVLTFSDRVLGRVALQRLPMCLPSVPSSTPPIVLTLPLPCKLLPIVASQLSSDQNFFG